MSLKNNKPDLMTILKRRHKTVQQFMSDKNIIDDKAFIENLREMYTVSEELAKIIHENSSKKQEKIKTDHISVKKKEKKESFTDTPIFFDEEKTFLDADSDYIIEEVEKTTPIVDNNVSNNKKSNKSSIKKSSHLKND